MPTWPGRLCEATFYRTAPTCPALPSLALGGSTGHRHRGSNKMFRRNSPTSTVTTTAATMGPCRRTARDAQRTASGVRSDVFELPQGFGVHRFQGDHARDAGGSHGAAMGGKGVRQAGACQFAGPAGADLVDAPACAPGHGHVVALRRAAGQPVASKKNDQEVFGSTECAEHTAARA